MNEWKMMKIRWVHYLILSCEGEDITKDYEGLQRGEGGLEAHKTNHVFSQHFSNFLMQNFDLTERIKIVLGRQVKKYIGWFNLTLKEPGL